MNAWEMCEGGRVHSDFESLERDPSSPVPPLADTGCPVDTRLFADQLAAESKLGPIEQEWETVDQESEGFVTVEMRVSRGARRKGFEILRDIITRHRRAWADRYLTGYLEARWKSELRAAGEAYNRHVADKGKPPTVKQFAAQANDAADHWFGGDLTAVYGALGLRSPLPPPTYTRLLPVDPRAFTRRLKRELNTAATHAQGSGAEPINTVGHLAWHSIRWVELAEALGEPPTLKQFGTRDFSMSSRALDDDTDTAWRLYCEAIERALTGESVPARPAQPARAAAGEPVERSAPVAAAATADSAHPAKPDDGVSAQASAKRAPEPTAPPRGLRGLLHRFDGH